MPTDPADLTRVAPLQVKDLVYERLRASLIDLTFAPGAPLREAALVQRFGVSKTPIREALVRLEREGLVEIAPYRGARARTYDEADLREFYEVREMLEIEGVRRVTEEGEAGAREALARSAEAGAAALQRGDLAAVRERLDEFDELLLGRLLLGRLPDGMISDLVQRLQAHLKRIGRPGAGPERLGTAVEEHRGIAGAVTARDRDTAQHLLRLHLRHLLADQLAALSP